jgi:MFS family permease
MQTTAQAWLVLDMTHSPLAVGLVITFQTLPVTLFALLGGVIADRLPKRQTIMFTQGAALIQAAIFGLLVALHAIELWHIYVLAVVQGIITAVDNPVRQAFVVEMVGREDVVNAVALNSMSFNGARIIGPAVAGLIIAKFGIPITLFLNAVSFIPVIIAMLMMNPLALFAARSTATGSVVQRLREGLSYSWHTSTVLLIMILVGAIGTFGYNFIVTLPLIGGFVLHTDAEGFGALSSFLGIGSVIGAISTAYIRNITLKRVLISAGAFSIIFGILALSTNYALSAVLLVALGFAGINFATGANTLLQLSVPDEIRGRVTSLYVLLFMGSTPVGGLLTGVLSNIFSVSAALLICAAFCLLGTLIAVVYYRAHPAPQAKPSLSV